MKLRGATICSGIGSPELAMSWVKWKFNAEIEPFPSAVLGHYWPHVPNLGDITADDFLEKAKRLGHIDLLVAGTPCQAFSVAGMRRSLKDARGNLTLRFVEIVDALRPKLVVWENVPGVLNTTDNAFGCLLGALVGADSPLVPAEGQRWTDAGIADGPIRSTAWRILDAQYFGLAQRRERVFVVASAGGWPHPAEILFEREGVQRYFAPRREARERSSSAAAEGITGSGDLRDPVTPVDFRNQRLPGDGAVPTLQSKQTGGYSLNYAPGVMAYDASEDSTGRGVPLVPWLPQGERVQDPDGVASGVTSNPAGGMKINPVLIPEVADPISRHEQRTYSHEGEHNFRLHNVVPVAFQADQTYLVFNSKQVAEDVEEDIAPTLRGMGHDESHANGALAFTERTRADGRSLESQEDLAYALTNPGSGGRTHSRQVMTPQPQMAVRRLTPVECEFLQGFPKNFTLVPYRGKPAADGPRYKAIGNSMAINVLVWIGNRIRLALSAGPAAGGSS